MLPGWAAANTGCMPLTLRAAGVLIHLKFKDGSGCDTIVTQYYSIGNALIVTYDTTTMFVTPSSCKGSDGSIRNITSPNATDFSWINLTTGATAGNTIDVGGLAAGRY